VSQYCKTTYSNIPPHFIASALVQIDCGLPCTTPWTDQRWQCCKK